MIASWLTGRTPLGTFRSNGEHGAVGVPNWHVTGFNAKGWALCAEP